MKILVISKYPPIQGGVSSENYWFIQALSEIGNDVTVLTNADEVEDSYRINIPEKDKELLYGFRRENAIKLINTHKDRKMVYIPQDNPVISKMVGLGLKEINESKPDIIISSYFEPYGVVAMILSMISGIPYTIRHAGSDIGRLIKCDQLEETYKQVLRKAKFVFTTEKHHERFEKLGVDPTRFVKAPSFRLPGDIFYPTENQLGVDDEFKLHSICKPGEAKGTKEMIQALKILKDRGVDVSLNTNWSGRHFDEHRKLAVEKDVAICNQGYIPHWRIPESIRDCHIGLFLENRFSIKFHTPGVPLEYWACGRPVVITEEVANKRHIRPHIKEGVNAFIVKSCPIQPSELADIIMEAKDSVLKTPNIESFIDASLMSLNKKKQLREFLEMVSK